ncbi:hypothetical protein D3C80_2108050 [compost metagenome]
MSSSSLPRANMSWSETPQVGSENTGFTKSLRPTKVVMPWLLKKPDWLSQAKSPL